MSLLDELTSASVESLSFIGRGTLGSIAGRPCRLAVDSIARQKPLASGSLPVGFMPTSAGTFTAAKAELTGHTVDSLLNQLLVFEGANYRITQATDNGLTFSFQTEAETAKR